MTTSSKTKNRQAINETINHPRAFVQVSEWNSAPSYEKVRIIMSFSQCSLRWQSEVFYDRVKAFRNFYELNVGTHLCAEQGCGRVVKPEGRIYKGQGKLCPECFIQYNPHISNPISRQSHNATRAQQAQAESTLAVAQAS